MAHLYGDREAYLKRLEKKSYKGIKKEGIFNQSIQNILDENETR